MKINYIVIVLISMLSYSTNAQYLDDMEGYIDGQPISEGFWTDRNCGGGPGCALMSSSIQAQSGLLSGLIPNDATTDAVLDLGNKIFGTWGLEFAMYVPSNQEAYFNLQGTVPIVAGESIVGNIQFNKDLLAPGMGLIDNAAIPVSFTFPHDQWFDIVINVDINTGIGASTWEMGVDGVVVVPAGTPFTNADGTYPTSLGGVELFSISTSNLYFLDDVCYINAPFFCNLGVSDLVRPVISAAPNPVTDRLDIQANDKIDQVNIFNYIGQELYSVFPSNKTVEVDMSIYSAGVYFVKVSVGKHVETIKIIR